VLGEDIANELVDWFNAVDLTYRTDLRELNELNTELIRWMFGFWATTLLVLAGFVFALRR
jgi:hypothetical protein